MSETTDKFMLMAERAFKQRDALETALRCPPPAVFPAPTILVKSEKP